MLVVLDYDSTIGEHGVLHADTRAAIGEVRGVTPIGVVLAVVACGDRICIALRSQHVGTARGLWSVVTGYLEPGVAPAEQAWIEICEELGLGKIQPAAEAVLIALRAAL